MRRVCAKCGVSALAGQGSSLQLGMEGAIRLSGVGGLPCRHELLFSDGSESGGAKGAAVERNKRGRGEGQQDHGGVKQARVEMVVGAGLEQGGEELRASRVDGAAPGERGSEAQAKGGVDKAGPTAGLEGGAGADEDTAMLEKGGAAVVDGSVKKMGQAAAAVVAEEGAASNSEPKDDVEAQEGEHLGLVASGDGAAVVAADEAETAAVAAVVAAEEAAAGVVAPVIEEEAQNLLVGGQEEEDAQDDLAADELLPPANLQQQQQGEEEQHQGDLIVLPWMGDFPGVFVMSTYFSEAYPKESLRKTRADTAKNMIQAVAVSDGVLPAYLIHVCLML